MTLLLWFVRILILLVIIRYVLRLVASARTIGPADRSRPRRTPERLGGTLVRDPHCGTFVPQDRAIAVGHGDNRQFFCSTECRDAWNGRTS